jgi:hypothetical protein
MATQRAAIYGGDVLDVDAIEVAAEDIETQLGPIDVWSTTRWFPFFFSVNEMKLCVLRAKHAAQGLQEGLRAQLLHDRSSVRTTMVQLLAHNTRQFDWARSRLGK